MEEASELMHHILLSTTSNRRPWGLFQRLDKSTSSLRLSLAQFVVFFSSDTVDLPDCQLQDKMVEMRKHIIGKHGV